MSGASRRSLPHARGGVSTYGYLTKHARMSSPRTWGCFQGRVRFHSQCRVFPTHVGVFLSPTCSARIWNRLPHARGGVSSTPPLWNGSARSSPRTWGCFRAFAMIETVPGVVPTHVGVFLRVGTFPDGYCRLPHARGGVSSGGTMEFTALESSPRTWGCFYDYDCPYGYAGVFPTHVGVFPPFILYIFSLDGLPHARGGVSPT